MSRSWSGTAYSAISGVNQSSTGVHTIAAWIYISGASQGDGLYLNNVSFTDWIWLGFDNSSGNQVVFQEGKSSTATEVRSSLTLNTWTHLCGVYDGTNMVFYVNGSSVGSTAFNPSGRSNFTGGDIGFGSVEAQDCIFINGTALSAVQVQHLMNQRDPRRVAAPTIWFPLHTDNFTTDFSGNGHSLTTGSGSSSAGTHAAPAVWESPSPIQALKVSSSATNITASGTTNVTGSASVTSAAGLAASGTTQVTGTASITSSASLTATGTTNVTGSASSTESASLVATGTTQVTGAATFENEYRHGSTTDLSASHSLAAWIYPTSSQTSHVFRTRMSSPANDRDSGGIELNGTTINFFGNNSANSAAYSYSTSVSLNTWTHVALVYDSSAKTYTSYINGVSSNSASFDGTGREATSNQWAIYGNFVGSMRAALIAPNYAMSAGEVVRAMQTRLSGAEYSGKGSNQGIFLPFWSSLNSRYLFGSPTAGNIAFVSVVGFTNDFQDGTPPSSWMGQTIIRPVIQTSAPISITATGTTQVTGSAAITSSASLVATGTTNVTGDASTTETANLVATGTTQVTGTASTTEAAALVATGTTQVTGSASSTESASLTATGTTQVTGSANLVTPGDVAATGLTQTTGAASVTASAPLTASGTTQTTGAAALTSTAPITAAGTTQVTGAAAVTSSAQLTATGTTQTTGAAVISITYSLTATGLTQVTGVAVWQGVAPATPSDSDTSASRRMLGGLGTRRRIRR